MSNASSSSISQKLRNLVKSANEIFKEIKFEYRVLKFKRLTPAFDAATSIFTFNYEDQRIRMKLPDVRDFISFNIIRRRTFYDIADLQETRGYIHPGSVIIDAGANIGNHSVYYARICKAARVFSFEPQEEIYNILKTNIELNGINDIVTPYKYALGEHNTRASVDFRDDHKITSRVAQTNHGGTYLKEAEDGNFEMRTLDELFLNSLDKLDYIKMDIQGFEEKAVKGGRELIKKFKPIIQLECMTNEEYNTVLLPLMTDLGYETKHRMSIDYIFGPVDTGNSHS